MSFVNIGLCVDISWSGLGDLESFLANTVGFVVFLFPVAILFWVTFPAVGPNIYIYSTSHLSGRNKALFGDD